MKNLSQEVIEAINPLEEKFNSSALMNIIGSIENDNDLASFLNTLEEGLKDLLGSAATADFQFKTINNNFQVKIRHLYRVKD